VARLLELQDRRGTAAAVPLPGAAAGPQPRAVSDAYSRRVALLKRVLPAIGLGLLLLVAAWPRLGPLLDKVRFAFPLIDRRDARELRMINPRYAGIDRLNRPYVLTAATGRQMPQRDDLMSLDRPRGQIIAHGGAKVVLTAATGVYQTQSKLLDLFGAVTLTHQNGTRFITQTAHIDFPTETASGHEPVAGRGPSGDITAEGFRILEKGDTIVFTGRSHLVLTRVSASRPAPPPPALPARIDKAAGEIAAAAPAVLAAGAVPASGTQRPTDQRRPAAQSGSSERLDPQNPALTESGMRHHGE
jgi:lipopolysaccharide export system protein LptC